MNLKKYIKLKENQPEDELTPEEEVLFNSLVSRIQSNEAACKAVKRVTLWKIFTPIVSVMGAIAIILTCVFTLRASGDFRYNYENIKSEETSFSELQLNTKCFDFSYIESNISHVTLSYDFESKDKLYYSVFAESEPYTLDLIVVINEKYDYKLEIADVTTKQLSEYSITYCSESSRGKPQINYKGWIKVQTETVYFEYTQIPDLGDEAFFESIQQIIQLKE